MLFPSEEDCAARKAYADTFEQFNDRCLKAATPEELADLAIKAATARYINGEVVILIALPVNTGRLSTWAMDGDPAGIGSLDVMNKLARAVEHSLTRRIDEHYVRELSVRADESRVTVRLIMKF